MNTKEKINEKLKYNLEFIKHISLSPEDLQFNQSEHANSKSVNKYSKNNYNNPKIKTCPNTIKKNEMDISSGSYFSNNSNNACSDDLYQTPLYTSKKIPDNYPLIKKQNDKINKLFKTLELKDREIFNLKTENRKLLSLRKKLEEYEKKLDIKTNKLQKALIELEEHKNKNEILNQNQETCETEISNYSSENEKLKNQLKLYENDNINLKQENEELIKKLELFKNNHLSNKNDLEALNDLLNNNQKITIDLNRKNIENLQKIKNLEKEITNTKISYDITVNQILDIFVVNFSKVIIKMNEYVKQLISGIKIESDYKYLLQMMYNKVNEIVKTYPEFSKLNDIYDCFISFINTIFKNLENNSNNNLKYNSFI